MSASELGGGSDSEGIIKSRWDELFSDPLLSLRALKDEAKSKPGIGEELEEGHVPLRSVYWRFFYHLLPDPSSLESWSGALVDSRARYDALRRRYLVAPDGRWAADCTAPISQTQSGSFLQEKPRSSPSYIPGSEGDAWDPLSLDTHNPWKDWFAHIELRTTIRKDVDRTFPDMPYFEDESVRKAMVTILFVWSMMHPDVGYRQGMHELLAVCYFVIDKDTLPPSTPEIDVSPLATKTGTQIRNEAMYSALDVRYVEHDAFQLFEALMKGAKASYEWRGEQAGSSSSPPTVPIIRRVNHLQSELLRKIDPQLWERLESEGVEAQIWAIRWIRLIFTRELPFSTALRIWDGIFAEDPSLGILDFVSVALILLIRNELLIADYPSILTALLHFPTSSTYPISPSLILNQATFLRANTSPSAGVEVVMQNQDNLGVRAQPPEPDPSTSTPHRRNRGQPAMGRGPSPRGMQGLTSAWIERAQAAGLDKAILSTVADLRRNLPDTATAYSYLPNLPFSPTYSHARDPSGQFSAIPSSISAIPNRGTTSHQVQPNSSASSKGFVDAQLADLRLAMLNMGQAMAKMLEQLPEGIEKPTMDGLNSIRDSLLCASNPDVADIVRMWAPPVASNAESDEGVETSVLDDGDADGRKEEGEEEEGDGDRMALKPTRSRSPHMPSPSPLPSASDVGPTTSSPDLSITPASTQVPTASNDPPTGPSYPPLHLSNRADRPSTGLPRVPIAERMAASLRPRSAQSTTPAHASSRTQSSTTPYEEHPAQPSDPLARTGVATVTSASRTGTAGNGLGRQQSLRRPGSHDPLGAG